MGFFCHHFFNRHNFINQMTYAEKLKDPRWQKKRLGVLERDNWTCVYCGDTKTTLHIHHKKYGEANPWDNPDSDLDTVCEDCHSILEYIKKQTNGILSGNKIVKRNADDNEIRFFCSAYNSKNGYKELIIVKMVSGEIVDGVWLNYKTINEIINEFI